MNEFVERSLHLSRTQKLWLFNQITGWFTVRLWQSQYMKLVGGAITVFKHMSSSMGLGWHPTYEMENNPNVPNHQPDWAVQSLRLIFMNQQTGLLNTATSYWDPPLSNGFKINAPSISNSIQASRGGAIRDEVSQSQFQWPQNWRMLYLAGADLTILKNMSSLMGRIIHYGKKNVSC